MGKISDTASRRVFVLWFITRQRGTYSARERETSTPARNAWWLLWTFLLARGNTAILTETGRALCKVFISFGRIAPCIEIANVTLDRLMHKIIPRTIFSCMGTQGLDVCATPSVWVGLPLCICWLLGLESLNGHSLSESDEFMKISQLL